MSKVKTVNELSRGDIIEWEISGEKVELEVHHKQLHEFGKQIVFKCDLRTEPLYGEYALEVKQEENNE